MYFEGKFTVNAPREKVREYILDLHSTLEYVLGIKKLDVQSDDKFTATVGVGVSAIRGTFDFEVEKVSPPHAKLKAHWAGIKSVVDLDSTFDLSDMPVSKTDIIWMADA